MKKTTKNVRKSLSLFLAVLMILTTVAVALPGSIFAADTTLISGTSGIGVQFFTADGKSAIDGVQVNHDYTGSNEHTQHTFTVLGFDTVRIRLSNKENNEPITVTKVEAVTEKKAEGDKVVYVGDSTAASATEYKTSFTIPAGGHKDLYVVSQEGFNEGGNIVFNVYYQVNSGKGTNICSGNEFVTHAYLYVNPAEAIRHGLHEGVNIEEHTDHNSHGRILSFWYYIESTKGFIKNVDLNGADKFLDDMSVTTESAASYDGRVDHKTFDFAEACYLETLVDANNGKQYNNGQCQGGSRQYSDGHAVTYAFYYDINEVKSWQDAGFQARFQENYISFWDTGVNLKYLRLASNDTYLNGISSSDKKFSVTFGYVPSVTNGKNQTFESNSTATVKDYTGNKSYYLSGKQNSYGLTNGKYEEFYATFNGNLPTNINATEPAKIMFSPKLNMQAIGRDGTAFEDSSYMTTHINLIPYDKTDLRDAVAAAEAAGYCSGYYYTAGFAAYEAALSNAKDVLGRGDTTQADIDAAVATLTAAEGQLKALEHKWGEVTYAWDEKNSTWTASRTCGNDDVICNEDPHTEIVAATATATEGNCVTQATTTYKATFADGKTDTKVVPGAKDPDAHDYGEVTYTWSVDEGGNKVCTATRVCSRDSSHVDTAKATNIQKETTGPICQDEATTIYTPTFDVDWAEKDKEPLVVEGKIDNCKDDDHDHKCDYCDDELTECEDTDNDHHCDICDDKLTECEDKDNDHHCDICDNKLTVCTDKAGDNDHNCDICGKPEVSGHTEVTVAGKAPTCTESGLTDGKKCSECGTTTVEQTTRPATGHDYDKGVVTKAATCEDAGEKTYTCKNDASHTYTETIPATGHDYDEGVVTKDATCTEPGEMTYTCKNDANHTYTEAISKTGHNWVEVKYEWNDDYTVCEAVKVCEKGCREVVAVDSDIVKQTYPATCVDNGKTIYYATFVIDGKKVQTTKEVAGTTKGPHNYEGVEVVYTWNADHTVCTATRVCKNDSTHVETANATIEKVTKDPACGVEGSTTYTATFKEDWAADQSYTEKIPALKHEWTVTYEWSEDNKTCTATGVCSNGHTETEIITSAVSEKAPNCSEVGETTYTANFKSEWAEPQEKVIYGDITDKEHHIWGEDIIVRPVQKEDGSWTTGTITNTCEKCGETETKEVGRADYTEYDAAMEALKELLKDEALTDSARKTIENVIAEYTVPDNLIVPEQDLIKAATVKLNATYAEINGNSGSFTTHSIVFGKTNGIGWYKVSKDGGETFETVFGNTVYEVKKGTELIISVGDLMDKSFTFYVNGNAIKPDENGNLVIKVTEYMLIGAIGLELENPDDPDAPSVPDAEESLNWFQRIIKAIKDFFAKLFGKN